MIIFNVVFFFFFKYCFPFPYFYNLLACIYRNSSAFNSKSVPCRLGPFTTICQLNLATFTLISLISTMDSSKYKRGACQFKKSRRNKANILPAGKSSSADKIANSTSVNSNSVTISPTCRKCSWKRKPSV